MDFVSGRNIGNQAKTIQLDKVKLKICVLYKIGLKQK
jgi:hypothetical protein